MQEQTPPPAEPSAAWQNRKQHARQLAIQGDFETAYQEFLELINTCPDDADVLANLGGVYFHLGQLNDAKITLERCLTLQPNHLGGTLNLANTLIALGEQEQATQAYQRVLAIAPDHAGAHAGIAHSLILQQKFQAAIDYCNQLLEKSDKTYEILAQKAEALIQLKQLRAAIKCLNEAITLTEIGSIQMKNGYTNLAVCLHDIGYHMQAIEVLERLKEIKSFDSSLLNKLGIYYCQLPDFDRSLSQFRQAWQQSRCYIDAINYYLIQPSFAFTAKTLKKHRHRYYRGIKKLLELDSGCFAITTNEWLMHPFNLGYQSVNMKPIMEGFTTVIHRQAKFQNPALFNDYLSYSKKLSVPSSQMVHSKNRRRLRLAFISDFFYSHSNQRAFEGLIKYIDKTRFDVIIIHGPLSEKDAVRDRIDDYVSCSIQIPMNSAKSYEIINSLNLDILFFTDLGMSPYMHLLAQLRMAPLQVTSWGLPYSSGLRTIDYYLSSELSEPKNAELHYTESLILLKRLPCIYMKSNLLTPLHDRDYFFLDKEDFLFGCLQNTIKYHPDFDHVLEKIAQHCPTAKFIVAEDVKAVQTIMLLDRLASTAPTFFQRIHPISLMKRDEYISLCQCIDVLIDPPYFGSGISFYESISTGTPTVTYKGKYMRSRYVSAAYEIMGIKNPPVCTSLESVADYCISLYHDREKLALVRSEILANVDCLYDDLDVVKEIEEFFISCS